MDALQGYGFTEQQLVFISEYAATANVSRAAVAAGVSRGTGYAWLAKREFMDAVQELRSRAATDAWTSLAAGLQDAVDVVRSVLTSDTATTNAKLRAADMLINQVQILTENREIVERIAKLEDMIDAP